MADENENKEKEIRPLFVGRLPIWASIEGFDPDNEAEILTEINEALSIHSRNIEAMDSLYWYRRGITPILARTKEVRPSICSKVNVSLPETIVTFKDGYFYTEPVTYVARKDEDGLSDKVSKLNDFLYRSGKQTADNKLVDWFHTVGKADLFVRSNADPEVPFKAYALDPRSAFVARSLTPEAYPVYGGYSVKRGDQIFISVWDRNWVITLKGADSTPYATDMPEHAVFASEIVSIDPNPLGFVPIIEYYYNSVMMSAFEQAIPLIDAINLLQSDRLDATEQAIQSLLVFYNCELGEDDKGNPITPAMVRESGALFLKSVGDNRADLKEIITNLDQSQCQVFIDNLYEQVLSICAMPSTGHGSHNAATANAALILDQWYQSDTAARNTEDLFKESNAYFDEIILHILREKNILDLDPADITLQFVRNETANIQSKAQAAQILLAMGMHPELALGKSGVSNDPVADVKMSEKYLKMIWGDPDKVDKAEEETNGQGEAVIIERSVSEGDVGGAV